MNDLKQRRLRMRLTQTQLGKRVGCSKSYISALENGKEKGSTALLNKIDLALDGFSYQPPDVPFKNEAERKELHEIWCENYKFFDK